MPQLDPTWFTSQLFWLALTFVGLYIVLSRMVLPPLMDVLARRDQTIRDDVEAAQRMKVSAEQARIDYEKAMNASRAKAQATVADALAAQKADAEQKAKALDAQLEQKLSAASAQIATKKAQLIADLAPTAAELAGLVVEKLVAHKPGSDQVAAALQTAKGKR